MPHREHSVHQSEIWPVIALMVVYSENHTKEKYTASTTHRVWKVK